VALSRQQLHELARLGAKVRLQELREEIAAIQALAGGGEPRGRGGRRGRTKQAGRPAGRSRRRGKLSPKGRAAIVAAQRARWAKVRAERARTAGAKK
jgi:hypothetical protein